MSSWSSCNAIISIYTYDNIPNFKELIDVVLDNAPKITGSEGDCVYTSIDFVKGKSCSYPCNKCPIYMIGITKRTKEYCPGVDSGCLTSKDIKNCVIRNLEYPLSREMRFYYDRCKIVVSSIHGLRDKTKDETIKEFNDFIKYLKTIFNGIFKVKIICKKIM